MSRNKQKQRSEPIGPKTLRRVTRNRKVIAGGVVLTLVVAYALVIPLIYPNGSFKTNLQCGLNAPLSHCETSGFKFFGTDGLGRDLMARIALGARYSMLVGTAAALLSASVGTALGLLAGYKSGFLGTLIMSLVDLQLALPTVLVALLVIAIGGPGLLPLVLAMVLSGWAQYARVIQGRVLSVREEGYVEAAKAVGAREISVILRHVLPQTFNLTLVLLTEQIGQFIMLESSLSYLGLGLQVPIPSLGNIAAEGRIVLPVAWWQATLPGALLTIAVSSLFVMGDGLRDALDPRQ